MCSCQQNSKDTSAVARMAGGTLSFHVGDMACGHCAGTITQAIEAKLPGTSVSADPGSKRVEVRGSADYAAIRSIVVAAGYTPSAQPIG